MRLEAANLPPPVKRKSSSSENPKLPAPPQLEQRRLSLAVAQWIGLAAMILVTGLAAAGTFGESWDRRRLSGSALEAHVEFPTRFSYQMVNAVLVDVRNVSGGTIDTVRIAIDTSYADRFSEVTFAPSEERRGVVALADMRPGESRRLRIDLQGEEYGRHEGRLTVAGGGDSLSTMLRTIIFP